MDEVIVRNVEDVLDLAQNAKLNPEELIPYTQCLEFASELLEEPTDLRLLELNSELLGELSEGKSLIIRGGENDASVLCTDSKTYEVKGAETTNSMLILSDLAFPDSLPSIDSHTVQPVKVLTTQYKYIELKLCPPRLHRLSSLLEENPYDGNEFLESKWNTFDELLNHVQGSREEILQYLKEIKAYKINDYWTLLSQNYHFKILSQILNYIEIQKWPLDSIPRKYCMEHLEEETNETVLEQCFDYFFKVSERTNNKGNLLYQILDDDVCRFFAETLLRPAGRFDLEEFLRLWQGGVPEGLCTNLSHLKGLALIDKENDPPVIKYFPASHLPENLTDRVGLLFETKERWTLDEIEPYLKEFSNEKTPIPSLLVKFARSSLHNGIKYFSRRYPR